jgi:hypothetical protein
MSGRGRFESLEQRQLLAGDVVVTVDGGNLMVQGDELDNKILITAGADAGSFVVTGLDGTNIILNGDPPVSEVTVADVRNARIRMGDGNDLVAVAGASLRYVSIGTGAGDDRVLVGTDGGAPELVGELPTDLSVAARSLRVFTDGDNDEVAVDDTSVRHQLAIQTGDGDDTASLGSTAAVNQSGARLGVRGGVHVGLGDGNDELNMDQVRVRGGIVVHAGDGDDTVDGTAVTSHLMAILGDGGVDSMTLADLDVRLLGIHTGEGNDVVDVQDSAFAAFGVSLGDGDDTLTTSALQARLAVMLGGDGQDTLNVLTENDFAHEIIRGFEIPPDINTGNLPGLRRLAGLIRRFH